MKTFAMLVVLCGVLLLSIGCETLTKSGSEHWHSYPRITSLQTRQAVHAWDYFWLAERPSRLSYEIVR